MIRYEEYLGWTFTIEWYWSKYSDEKKFQVMIYNRNDEGVRSSCKYASLYEAETLAKQTIHELSTWY